MVSDRRTSIGKVGSFLTVRRTQDNKAAVQYNARPFGFPRTDGRPADRRAQTATRKYPDRRTMRFMVTQGWSCVHRVDGVR